LRGRSLLIIFIIIIAGSLVFTATNFYLDLLWFQDLEAGQVFWTQYLTRWGVRIGALLFLFVFFFVNLMFTRRYVLSFPNLALRERLMATGFMRYLTPRRLTIYFLIGAAVLAYMFSGYAGSYWMDFLRFFNHVPFTVSDPIFGVNVAFYVFKLPLYRFLYGFLMMAIVISILMVGAIYLFLNPPVQGGRGWTLPTGRGFSHLAVLLSLIFGLKAWDYRLQQLELVLSERGVVYGAGYTDIHANYMVLLVLMIMAAAIALLFIANIFLRRSRLFLYGILALIGVSLLGGWAYPAGVQSFVVEPSEFAYEREYLEHNIEYTRSAYGLDNFASRSYEPGATLTWDDLRENTGTIKNVRLWDYRPLLNTFNELQAIRPYYRFNNVDIDRYTVDGEYRQVMLSARELDKSRLAEQARTWVNMQLQYTHGYGLTVSPVNEVTSEGLPRYFLGDIPPTGNIEMNNPAIYFGELTNDYVIVNTDTPEFHYATAGDENEYTYYEGSAGIPLHSFLRRALFALKFGEYRILVSNELNRESRFLFDRNIHERVRRLAPFLHYDDNPYIVAADGRLFWVQDAYTVTERYPYSAPIGGINYIRNSVKVVIDAYNGSVDYYIADPEDPLVQTYRSIFPELFKSFEEMPESLMAHLRYPVDIFNIQSKMLTLYHITDPNVFYTREDLWAIPLEQYFGQEQLIEPYYTILQLPGYSEPEYVLILPFTPDKRNNMIAWLVARCDQPNFGEVEMFLFPKERVILGPKQVENRIDQDTEISEQFTLWSQSGSRVIRGNLLVLPINNALLYVEPVFLEAEGGGLPELARVIVVFQDKVVMENTLEEALIHIFGELETVPADIEEDLSIDIPEEAQPDEERSVIADEDLAELIGQAQAVYEEALQRQQEGDWAGYGEKIEELEEILSELGRLLP